MVHDVRRTLFETVSSFPGNLEAGKDLEELIERQFMDYRKLLGACRHRCSH